MDKSRIRDPGQTSRIRNTVKIILNFPDNIITNCSIDVIPSNFCFVCSKKGCEYIIVLIEFTSVCCLILHILTLVSHSLQMKEIISLIFFNRPWSPP
jgi:hypothetical protein